jgi:ubiquinone/menaquinone biosynthesis C-methylase UbiE
MLETIEGFLRMDEKSFKTKNTRNESDVIRFYDEYSQAWDHRFGEDLSSAHFLDRRWRSFIDMLEEDVRSKTALELGVGTGVYVEKASCIFKELIAVDGSRLMLGQLERRINKSSLINVRVIQANVVSIPEIRDESVDIVYFFGLIEHMIRVDDFIREIQRVLKRGGFVIGVTPNGSSPWYGLRRFIRGTGKHCSTDKYYTVRQIERKFEKCGFQDGLIRLWGFVPAGLTSICIYRLLVWLESRVERSCLKTLCGGLTFRFRKS